MQTDSLIAAIKTAARNMYPNPAWYPNTAAVLEEFLEQHDNVEQVMPKKAGSTFGTHIRFVSIPWQ